MSTAPKRKAPSKVARSAKKPSPPSGPSTSAPFLRFHHSEALRKTTLSALTTLEQADDPTRHRETLADVVVELTKAGLEAYFLEPLELARVGFLVRQSANLGISGAQQVMGSVIRRIIGGMDGPQLLSVCGSIRRLML